MAVLRNEDDAPADLREHAVILAGHVLEFDPALEGGRGYARALELLASGAALTTMERMIEAQGRRTEQPQVGRRRFDVAAPKAGTIRQIDCERIARIARLAGAPMDEGAGIDLFCKVGSHVRSGETLYRIYANSETGLGFACDLAAEHNGYEVTS
jgi:thymidine phosphorylase